MGLPKDCRLNVISVCAIISCCALDGHCYFLVCSGWSLLFPGVLVTSQIPHLIYMCGPHYTSICRFIIDLHAQLHMCVPHCRTTWYVMHEGKKQKKLSARRRRRNKECQKYSKNNGSLVPQDAFVPDTTMKKQKNTKKHEKTPTRGQKRPKTAKKNKKRVFFCKTPDSVPT